MLGLSVNQIAFRPIVVAPSDVVDSQHAVKISRRSERLFLPVRLRRVVDYKDYPQADRSADHAAHHQASAGQYSSSRRGSKRGNECQDHGRDQADLVFPKIGQHQRCDQRHR